MSDDDEIEEEKSIDSNLDVKVQEYIETYFGGYTRLFLFYFNQSEVKRILQTNPIPEEFLKIYRRFLTDELRNYIQEQSNEGLTHIEYYWWYQLFGDTGMGNAEINSILYREAWGDLLWNPRQFTIIESLVEELKEEGVFPSDISAEEYVTMLFLPITFHLNLHPGDPLYNALGVKSGTEFREKYQSIRLLLAKKIVDNDLEGIMRAIIHDSRREYYRKNSDSLRLSEKSKYTLVDSRLMYKGKKPKNDDGNEFEDVEDFFDNSCKYDVLTDQEWLESFGRLAGIDINELTIKNQALLLELRDAIHEGYDFSSKSGDALKDFYGDKADSKKTLRSRVFNRIRALKEGSDKANS